ncbi:MAG: hypothetical protein U9Q82_09300 [Chloroflexota bacterium]|nr:hypothetical protein [Chloroflexota bacterium]
MGLLSILVLLVGAIMGVNLYYAWGGLLLVGIILRRSILEWWQLWQGLVPLWKASDNFGRSIAIGVGLIFLFTLTVALSPPLKFDSLSYHLAVPQVYLNTGRITYIAENMLWGMPQLASMLYLWSITLAGIPTAGVICWCFGLLAIIGLLGFVSQKLNVRAAWVAVASLMASYSLASSLAWVYVDWASILFGLVIVISLDLWRISTRRAHILLAGTFAGLIMGIKYTAGVLIFAGLVNIWWVTNKHNVSFWRPMVEFVIVAGVFSFPWFGKNLVATGNPFYPFIFPSGEMNNFRLSLYQSHPIEGNWQDLLFLPIRATFLGIEGGRIIDGPGYSSSIGPLLIGLGALAWVNWRAYSQEKRCFVKNIAILSGVSVLLWAVAGRITGPLLSTHLYFSIFPLLAILAGIGFLNIDRLHIHNIRLGYIASVLVGMVLWFNLIQVGVDTFRLGAPQVQLGIKTEQDYMTENLGWHIVAMQSIRDLPADANVLMLWEPRSLYCQPQCNPDEVIDRWLHDLAIWQTPAAVLNSWQNTDFTHVLYYRTGADLVRQEDSRYTPADWQALDQLLTSLPEPIEFGDAYALYSLEP